MRLIYSMYTHPFHILNPSPWPFCVSFNLFNLLLSVVLVFHYKFTIIFPLFMLISLAISLMFWWRDVIRESTFEFKHTPYVRRGLLLGVMLFIISEIMFFFGFFWGFFHVSLVPTWYIGGIWPPAVIDVISPWGLPLVNTLCLLLSGLTLTISHGYLNNIIYFNSFKTIYVVNQKLLYWLFITLIFGVFFLTCQALEYYLSPFTLQDTVYGATFYILTGLHGLHVIVGTIFLMVCFYRAANYHFTIWKQVGLKAAVWYWHFVDVVWIFLFLVIYIWGSL